MARYKSHHLEAVVCHFSGARGSGGFHRKSDRRGRGFDSEGKVLYAGLSEASAGTIFRAHVVQPISAVEIEYSLWSRDIEDDVLPVTREPGIVPLPARAFARIADGRDYAC